MKKENYCLCSIFCNDLKFGYDKESIGRNYFEKIQVGIKYNAIYLENQKVIYVKH